jgi:hypothetical protein
MAFELPHFVPFPQLRQPSQTEVTHDGATGVRGAWPGAVSQAPPLGFCMRALPAGVEAQFVIPFDALKAVFDAAKEKEPKE